MAAAVSPIVFADWLKIAISISVDDPFKIEQPLLMAKSVCSGVGAARFKGSGVPRRKSPVFCVPTNSGELVFH